MTSGKANIILIIVVVLVLIGGVNALSMFLHDTVYDTDEVFNTIIASTTPPLAAHIEAPEQVKAIYMTSWVAGSPMLRDNLVKLMDETEINTVVIDIKDYTGRISFEVNDPKLQEIGSVERRIRDFRDFITVLHDRGIYVIGRVSTFQDAYYVNKYPQYAVKTKSGAVWKDRKGIKWLDAGAKDVWDYLIRIGKESYDAGVDEINYDYIRFPSDGDMDNIAYPYSEGKQKSVVLTEFFEYVRKNLGDTGVPISADLFGLTTSTTNDLGIGQLLEPALKNFDYVYPMVYPSHYPAGFIGIKNPASEPYKIIHYAMAEGIKKAIAASTSPQKLRPWLQDFDLGADYDADMIRAQIQATYDVGLNGWLLWSASNKYTKEALLPQ